MLIVLQSASKLLDTGLNTVQSTLLLKKQVEVEKVQEDLDIKRRQFAERMTACKRKEEELKKKQTQVCMYNFQRKFCRLVNYFPISTLLVFLVTYVIQNRTK